MAPRPAAESQSLPFSLWPQHPFPRPRSMNTPTGGRSYRRETRGSCVAPQRSVAVVPLITTRSSGGVTMDVRSEKTSRSSDRVTGVGAPASGQRAGPLTSKPSVLFSRQDVRIAAPEPPRGPKRPPRPPEGPGPGGSERGRPAAMVTRSPVPLPGKHPSPRDSRHRGRPPATRHPGLARRRHYCGA